MGLVNVVLPNGRTVAVSEEDAARLNAAKQATPETPEAAAGRVTQGMNEGRSSGFFQGVATTLEGAADSLSGGLYGKVAGAIAPDYAEDLANRGQNRPGMRMLGEVGAYFTPFGVPGLASKTGLKVATKTGSKLLGRAAEGGIVGVGGAVATTNVTGDPLTIEGTLVSMGTGAVLNVGFGAAADKVKSWGTKAAKVADEAKVAKGDVAVVKEGREKFEKTRESFTGLQTALKAAEKDAGKLVKEEASAFKQYKQWVSPDTAPNRINGAIKQAEKARNELQSRLNKTKYGKAISETGEALDDATAAVGKAKDKAAALTGSTEDWPKVMGQVDDAINTVKSRYGDKIGNKTAEAMKEFSERASQIRRMRQGGQRLEGSSWVPDTSIPPDPDGALRELHKLRADFSKKYGGVKFPDVPELPGSIKAPLGQSARPTTGPAGQMDEVRQLSGAAGELSDGISTARTKLKAGDYEGAADELRMLRERAAKYGQNDLALPQVPRKAAAIEEALPSRIPKSLPELAGMKPETVARLDDFMKDPRVASEVEKLAKELGLDATDGIAGLHSKLGKYMDADRRLVAMARKEAEDEAGGGLLAVLRRGAKRFAYGAAGRAADVSLGGGTLGILGRVGATEGTRLAMNATEDLISGSMMSAKLSIKSTIAGLVAKTAPGASKGLEKLGPISAYLTSHVLTGEPDKEADHDIQAATVKQVANIAKLAHTAPDAAFIAVQSLLGHASDAAYKMSSKIVGDMQYLMQVAPKDPGIAMHGFRSEWQPSHEESLTFGYVIEAVTNPIKAIERTIAGDGHPAAVEALWVRWPALMQTAASEYTFALNEKQEDLDYDTAMNFSLLFRTPMTTLADPAMTLELQGLYLPRSEGPQSAADVWRGQASGNPVGRPAAVQSDVAGSSVSGLISQ